VSQQGQVGTAGVASRVVLAAVWPSCRLVCGRSKGSCSRCWEGSPAGQLFPGKPAMLSPWTQCLAYFARGDFGDRRSSKPACWPKVVM
jgi:hypothetical protein